MWLLLTFINYLVEFYMHHFRSSITNVNEEITIIKNRRIFLFHFSIKDNIQPTILFHLQSRITCMLPVSLVTHLRHINTVIPLISFLLNHYLSLLYSIQSYGSGPKRDGGDGHSEPTCEKEWKMYREDK